MDVGGARRVLLRDAEVGFAEEVPPSPEEGLFLVVLESAVCTRGGYAPWSAPPFFKATAHVLQWWTLVLKRKTVPMLKIQRRDPGCVSGSMLSSTESMPLSALVMSRLLRSGE